MYILFQVLTGNKQSRIFGRFETPDAAWAAVHAEFTAAETSADRRSEIEASDWRLIPPVISE